MFSGGRWRWTGEKGLDGWLVEAHRLQATNYLNAKPKSLAEAYVKI